MTCRLGLPTALSYSSYVLSRSQSAPQLTRSQLTINSQSIRSPLAVRSQLVAILSQPARSPLTVRPSPLTVRSQSALSGAQHPASVCHLLPRLISLSTLGSTCAGSAPHRAIEPGAFLAGGTPDRPWRCPPLAPLKTHPYAPLCIAVGCAQLAAAATPASSSA